MADINDLRNQFNDLKKELQDLRGTKVNLDFDNSSVINAQEQINLLTNSIRRFKDSIEEIADGFKSTLDVLNEFEKEIESIDKKILKSALKKEAKDINKILQQVTFNQKNIGKGFVNQKDVLKTIKGITSSINNLELELVKNASNLSPEQDKITSSLIQNLNYTKSVAEEQLRMLQTSESTGVAIKDMAESLSTIPGIGKMISKPFQSIAEDLQQSVLETQTLNQELKVLELRKKDLEDAGASISDIEKIEGQIDIINKKLSNTSGIFSIIGNKFRDLLGSITAMGIAAKFIQLITKELVAADKSATELARKFNMTKSAAIELRNNIRDANIEQGSYLTTTDDVLQTMMSLQDTTGRFVALRQQDLQIATELLKVVGLTEKATAGLAQMSQINNTSLEATEKSILGSSVQLQAQTGLFIDNKQLLEDIGGLSDALRVKFKNNADEMALTVTKSRQLGFSMEALSQVQSNILNFESSIAAELEAELLTGKELNLEKARYYALTNQQSKLQDEIIRQVGTLNEFENMNVLQQNAYAQALGMSVDDLSKILLTQEQNAAIQKEINRDQKLASLFDGKVNKEKLIALAKSGDLSREQLDILGEATGENLRQLSIQEKMEKTMTRLSEIFLSVMDPIISVVNMIDKVITGIGKLLSDMGPGAREGLGRALAFIGGGAFIASIAKLLTKGTFINPMITAPVTGRGLGNTGFMGNMRNRMRGPGFMRGGIASIGGLITTGATNAFTEQGSGANIAGNTIGQALTMGGTGAMIGSMIAPGIGTAIGAGLGALAGGIMGYIDATQPQLAAGGIVTAPTRALVGEDGSEAVIPLDAFYRKFDELISETKAISNMRVQLETGVIAGHMTNGGTKTG